MYNDSYVYKESKGIKKFSLKSPDPENFTGLSKVALKTRALVYRYRDFNVAKMPPDLGLKLLVLTMQKYI
jgi:hypothetical protein